MIPDQDQIYLLPQAKKYYESDPDRDCSFEEWKDRCTRVAAEHQYGCRCVACAAFFVFSLNIVDFADGEFGPWNEDIIRKVRLEMGLPMPTHEEIVNFDWDETLDEATDEEIL